MRITAVGAAIAAGVVLSGMLTVPAAGAPIAAPAAAPPTVRWAACDDPKLTKAGVECGTLAVPLDRDHPRAGTVTLALTRLRHTVPDSQYQGILLVNPGGPGASGYALSQLQRFVPKGAGNAYDWIGFDPRGVGRSTPSLHCDPGWPGFDRPNYVPTTRELERVWLQRSRDYAQRCAPSRALLQHIKTTDSVADMESIRTALGERQLNYLGFSYGTYLGQVYATQHPEATRRMVFDSNVDPRKVWYQANLDQDVAFDRNINIWFGWVAEHDGAYHLGTTQEQVKRTWYAQLPRLDRTPAGGGRIGPDEWTDSFLGAGYSQSTWTELASAFSEWVNKGNDGPVTDLYVSGNTGQETENGYAVYNAVQCTDVQWPKDWDTWRRDNWATHAVAPFQTWGNAWFNAPCLSWPAPAGKPVGIDGSKAPGPLLIGETLDAATPFEGSLEVRSRFPRSALIGEPGGTTHAGSLYGNACVDDAIADYFATGALPDRKPGRQADATCAPLPEPEPEAAAKALSAKAPALAGDGALSSRGRLAGAIPGLAPRA